MDGKTINNKEVKATVEFECFLLNPGATSGERAGNILLHAYNPDVSAYIVTSYVIDIHQIDDTVYVETKNSLYKLDGTKRIRHLEEVKKYINNEYTSFDLFNNCVSNLMPTSKGWIIY